jgi:hypothetical protein
LHLFPDTKGRIFAKQTGGKFTKNHRDAKDNVDKSSALRKPPTAGNKGNHVLATVFNYYSISASINPSIINLSPLSASGKSIIISVWLPAFK